MSLEQRIVDLESVVAHLQHDLEQVNRVVIEQRKLIETLQGTQGRLEHRLSGLEEGFEQRDPAEERPPHY